MLHKKSVYCVCVCLSAFFVCLKIFCWKPNMAYYIKRTSVNRSFINAGDTWIRKPLVL